MLRVSWLCVDLQKDCKGTKIRLSLGTQAVGKFILTYHYGRLIYHYGRVKWEGKPVCMGNNF